MQPAGGGALRSGSGDPLPRSLCQLDPAALLMLLVDADQPEPVRNGARELALFLTPEPRAEVGDGGWRSGRRVFGLRVRSPRAPAGGVDGCGPSGLGPGHEPSSSLQHPIAPGAGASGLEWEARRVRSFAEW